MYVNHGGSAIAFGKDYIRPCVELDILHCFIGYFVSGHFRIMDDVIEITNITTAVHSQQDKMFHGWLLMF